MAEKFSFHPFGDCDSEAPELADQGALSGQPQSAHTARKRWTMTRSTRVCLVLWLIVLRSLVRPRARNGSRNLPGNGKKDGIVRAVRQDRHHRHRQRKGAGRV